MQHHAQPATRSGAIARLRRMIARPATLVGVLIAVSAPGVAAHAGACEGPACGGALLLVGTRASGPGTGIAAVRLDPATGALTPLGLAAEIDKATWLLADPKRRVVYAVGAAAGAPDAQANVYSLTADGGTGRLATLSRAPSGGRDATFLALAPDGGELFVANYGSGQLAAVPVDAAGTLAPPMAVAQDTGSGPTKRQAGPHAHAAVPDPSGRFVLVPDLGADRLFVYRWDRARKTLTPAAEPFVALPPGSGPRHLAFTPDGRFAFLVTELTAEVHGFRWDARTGRLTPASRIALDPPDFGGARSAAEIATSRDGRFLYVSNRGENLIQLFAIDHGTGMLTEVQRIASGGQVPWSFAFDPSGRWLVVANQGSGNLAVFAVAADTGRLSPTAGSLPVMQPVALAFLPAGGVANR